MLTNIAIVVFMSGRFPSPQYSTLDRVIAFFALENISFALYMLVALCLPAPPSYVRKLFKRHENTVAKHLDCIEETNVTVNFPNSEVVILDKDEDDEDDADI